MKQLETVQNIKGPKWLCRKAKSSDLPFIYATWLNSYWADGKRPGVTKTSFYKTHRKLIDCLLLNADILVAFLPAHEDVIVGYVSYYKDYLNYIFVKEDFRKFGIAKDLYEKALLPKQCTYLTIQVRNLLNKYQDERLIYSPLFITNLLLQFLEAKEN